MTPIVQFKDLGLIDYQEAWDIQQKYFNKSVADKLLNKKVKTKKEIFNYLFFCEHPHVYTLGKSGNQEHLLLKNEEFKKKQVTFFKIDRGGDITYHGPNQIVVYPIIDLEQFFTDIHKYLRVLEEIVIKTISEYNIKGERYEGYTGVWVDVNTPNSRKICAIGVRCSRWITMHGFALNVNPDLSYFNNIVPCGIYNKGVTSIAKETNQKININEVKEKLKFYFKKLFKFSIKGI